MVYYLKFVIMTVFLGVCIRNVVHYYISYVVTPISVVVVPIPVERFIRRLE